MRCHARCQCPRSSRSEVIGNKYPAPDLADPCEEHRTSGRDSRRTRRTSPRQEAHSAAGKKDDLVTAPHPRSRSRCRPASPVPCVFHPHASMLRRGHFKQQTFPRPRTWTYTTGCYSSAVITRAATIRGAPQRATRTEALCARIAMNLLNTAPADLLPCASRGADCNRRMTR